MCAPACAACPHTPHTPHTPALVRVCAGACPHASPHKRVASPHAGAPGALHTFTRKKWKVTGMAVEQPIGDGTMTQAEFARYRGWRKSYVTGLKHAGRLVLTSDGRRIRVAETLARLAATADPSKRPVSEASIGRAAAASISPCATGVASVEADLEDAEGDAAADTMIDTGGYQEAKAMRERYLAKGVKRDYLMSIGKLLPTADVTAAVAAAAATLRTRLEALPATLAPQVVSSGDEAAVTAILAEAIEHALSELTRQFGALGRAEA